ncbi:hypothetical protein O6H91_03G006100 [Diphasiastrum complanatum]|nr:hypothetical protein O6H91_03G006100 [Diphasiastrum complanatum]KAJ7560919.1 hypothetical protein O6H91_03G006100 [Diphasiastrum complanatum]
MWRKWSLKFLFQETDKRHLQQQIDVHRLYLFTSFNRLKDYTDEKTIKEIVHLAEETPFEAQQEQVQANVHEQICRLAGVLDNILLPQVVKTTRVVSEKKNRPSGLSFAVHGSKQTSHLKKVTSAVETHPYSKAQVSTLLKEKLGYTLELKPSQISHSEAGEGLFLRGTVRPGTVVSLYPGIVYSPSQYRYIPGYPRVDVDNPYLISRYDGAIIDAKPWERGGESREWWDGQSHDDNESAYSKFVAAGEPVENMKAILEMEDFRKKQHPSWWQMLGGQQINSVSKGEIIERRNPLAVAHFANHPPKGELPNVMVCSYDFFDEDINVRPYIPNVLFADEEDGDMQRRGMIWVNEGRKSRSVVQGTLHEDVRLRRSHSLLRALVLVATREIKDEEILLNYRLSNQKKRPSWYHAVDEEEDKRRWS